MKLHTGIAFHINLIMMFLLLLLTLAAVDIARPAKTEYSNYAVDFPSTSLSLCRSLASDSDCCYYMVNGGWRCFVVFRHRRHTRFSRLFVFIIIFSRESLIASTDARWAIQTHKRQVQRKDHIPECSWNCAKNKAETNKYLYGTWT